MNPDEERDRDRTDEIDGTGQKHRILVYNQRRREGVLGGPKRYVQSMFGLVTVRNRT